jgi:hypothetical protein
VTFAGYEGPIVPRVSAESKVVVVIGTQTVVSISDVPEALVGRSFAPRD